MFKKLDLIESTNGSLAKTQILTEWIAENKIDATAILTYTFSPYQIFGVSVQSVCKACGIEDVKNFEDIGAAIYNKYIGKDCGDARNYPLDFFKLCEELKIKSGNEAIALLNIFFESCTANDAKWYARILCKDLRCGIGWSAVNKALKANNIAELKGFDVGLCASISNKKEEFIKAIHEKFGEDGEIYAYCEPKYDGIRLIISNETGKTVAMTRNGKVKENVEFLLEEFDRIANGHIMAIDGELMSAESFFNVTKKVEGRGDRYFVAWDLLAYGTQDFRSDASLHKRQWHLNYAIGESNSDIIKIIDSHVFHRAEQMYNMFEAYVSQGYEGMIIKSGASYDQTYKRKEWFKVKPIKEGTFRVVDQHYGSGKYADKLSVITIEDKTGKLVSRVGTGFDDATVDYMTNNSVIGKLVEVKFDCITPENDWGKKSLRFPRFVKWRDDIVEEDSI